MTDNVDEFRPHGPRSEHLRHETRAAIASASDLIIDNQTGDYSDAITSNDVIGVV